MRGSKRAREQGSRISRRGEEIKFVLPLSLARSAAHLSGSGARLERGLA